ncbi:MAG: ribonuclease P protein component [Chlorobi bacterium]|nr:ribonuclease P protein component [Chlorobiota bacterium]
MSPVSITMKRNAFQKAERLSSKKRITELFSGGKSFFVEPFLIFWKAENKASQRFPAETAIGIPKKKIRKAVHRNLLKRRIREAYRTNKFLLYDSLKNKNLFLSLFILYQDDKIIPFRDIEEKVVLILQKIIRENEKNTG